MIIMGLKVQKKLFQNKKHRKQKASKNKVYKQFEKRYLVHKYNNKDIDYKNRNFLNNNS
jgi:hypothetical protein